MVGLEPSIGRLHEFTGAQTRESCVYDLMEPFRWLGDIATIEASESGVLDVKDFYFTGDDYSYRIEIEAKRRFLQLLKDRFNSRINYKGKTWNWNAVIQLKTQELARLLLGKSHSIDFTEPAPKLERTDTRWLREIIRILTTHEARKLGISKSTLHYLRKRVKGGRSFKAYPKVRRKLEGLGGGL